MAARFWGVIVITALLASCQTNSGIYDPSVPPEKLCTLEVGSTLIVTYFDGIEVKWTPPFIGNFKIQIPEGQHTFVADNYESFNSSGYTVAYTTKDLEYTFTFEAGNIYIMESEYDLVDRTYHIKISEKGR